ncbi:short chain dehydrogenase reductase [Grosmannia clavigera kw1407]|uniref:Short chain dehydrogenase reductase n=1 Tax=Grosmannia clavigera (strain kw1407 / UAMH 11150) TaxID=655863 RepID=F0XCR8_GROCL|nr:short chain dehydrogenase reductase [Grosmannia clavigera kw1407]EFX03443.1 short chain dehydrogenase reductase [Grosmannia clavigera kw1407]
MSAPFPSPTKKWHDNTYPSLSPTRPELSAKGKNVLITGGGTGIGAETARSFAQAGAARIGLIGRREQPLLDTKASIESSFPGIEVVAAPADVTNKDQVEAAFARFSGTDGQHKIDVLVSGAAILGPPEAVDTVDGEKLVQVVDFTARNTINVTQAFLKHAAKQDAVVVNISSSVAHLDFGGFYAAYAVAKFAAYRLWDLLASTHPELSIYHIQPGVVDTDINREVGGMETVGFKDHVSLPATFSVWLASPEARFLKRKFLWANWDVDELKARAKELESATTFNLGLVGWPFGESGFMPAWDPES